MGAGECKCLKLQLCQQNEGQTTHLRKADCNEHQLEKNESPCHFNRPGAPYTEDFMQLSKSLMIYKDSRKSKQHLDEILPHKGREMVDIGYVNTLCNLLDGFPGRLDMDGEDVEYDLLEILQVYSNKSSKVFECLCQQKHFLVSLVKHLEKWSGRHSNNQTVITAEEESLLEIRLSILTKCAENGTVMKMLKENKADEIVKRYVQSDIQKLRLPAVEFLSTFTRRDEDIVQLLGKGPRIYQDMASMMGKAIQEYKTVDNKSVQDSRPEQKSDQRWQTDHWSVNRLLHFLKQIMTADDIKLFLVESQYLPLLANLLETWIKSGSADTPRAEMPLNRLSNDELLEVLELVLQLSFLPSIREKIVKEKELVRLVYGLYTQPEKTGGTREDKDAIYKKCQQILWLLQEDLSASFAFREIGEEMKKLKGGPSRSTQEHKSTDKGHIMISYQWDNQPMILKIHERLVKEGFKVWIDVECMEGCLLHSMAKAVEDCHTFLLAASQKYKDSPNCRLEAGYASDCKKKIIPLMMERDLDHPPDGWLGLLIGKLLYYDFSSDDKFESSFQNLLRVLSKEN